MARLFQAGAEMREHFAEGISTHTSTPPFTYTTEEARTGQYSYKITSSGTLSSTIQILLPSTSGNEVYVRGYFKFASFSPNDMSIIYMTQGSGFYSESLVINSSGVLGWRRHTFAPDFSATGPTISLNTWHRIEYSVFYDNSLGGSQWIIRRNIRVDGIPYTNVSTSPDTVSNPFWSAVTVLLGWVNTEGTVTPKVMYVDDIAINDSGGSEHNSWPGEGSIDVLKPVSDGPRGTGWAAALGETVNLWADIQPKDLNTGRYILHNSTVQSIYYTNYQTLGSLGIENNSQIQTMQPILAAGKFNTPNSPRPITFARSGHPAWPTMLFNPPNVLSGVAYPGNWEIQRPIFTDKTLWSSSVWTLSQNSAFGFSRVSSSGNFILVRYAGIVVEYKKPIEFESDLTSEGVINIITRRERFSSEVLSAASNSTLASQRQRTGANALLSTTNAVLLSQRLRHGLQTLSSTSMWNVFGNRELTASQSLSSSSDFASIVQRQRFNTQNLSSSSDVELLHQRLRSDSQDLTAMSSADFASALEAAGALDFDAVTLTELMNARERLYDVAFSSNTDALFEASRELYSTIDFNSLSDLSQTTVRERTRPITLSGRSSLTMTLLFETLFDIAFDAESSLALTSAREATFSGTWLSESSWDADLVAERMTAFGLTSESSFDSLFLRERTDDLHTSATTDISMPISRERSGELDFDASTLIALLAALERQGIVDLSADTDFAALANVLKSSGIDLISSTTFTADSLRERWLQFDATASSELSGLAQAIYGSGLSLTGNSLMFVTSEAGGLILAEITLNSDGSFDIEAIRNLTSGIDLTSTSELTIPIPLRERAFSTNYTSESIQSLLSAIEAVGGLSFDSATDLTMARQRERSLSAAFDAQSGILVPFERLRSVAVPYSASGTLSLSLDLTVLGQLYFQSTGTLLSEAVRELGGTLPLDSTGAFDIQSARELASSLELASTGYLAITYHSIDYIPSIEYYFRHRGNRFFRNIPIREMLVPVLREPWFNEFHIEQQLQTKDLLPFFIKIDRDDR